VAVDVELLAHEAQEAVEAADARSQLGESRPVRGGDAAPQRGDGVEGVGGAEYLIAGEQPALAHAREERPDVLDAAEGELPALEDLGRAPQQRFGGREAAVGPEPLRALRAQ